MFTTIKKHEQRDYEEYITENVTLIYHYIVNSFQIFFKPVRNNYICFVTILILLIYKITDNSIMNIHEYSKISFISTKCVWICFVSADSLEPYKI